MTRSGTIDRQLARGRARVARLDLRLHPSARLRILGWYVVVLGVAMSAALLLQSAVLHRQLDEEVDTALVAEIDRIRRVADEVDANGVRVHPDVAAIFDTYLGRSVSTEGEAIFTLIDGRPYKSTVVPVQLLSDPSFVERWSGATATVADESATSAGAVRWIAVPVLDGSSVGGTFIAANFLDGERAEVDQAVRIGAVIFGTIFALGTAAAWLIAGRILRPVRELTDAAREIDDGEWSRRIPVRGDDEIAQLARTFNDMIDRLEQAFATQRRFLDDAGHELQTPITIIRGHLEVATDADDPTDRAATMALVIDELDQMSRMVDDLLVLAREGQPDFVRLDPVDVADLTADLARRAEVLTGRAWEIDAVGDGVVPLDRGRITQAVLNLARNSVVHTPTGTSVSLGSSFDGGEVVFWVHDEGPGFPLEDRARIFDRFHRGASSTRGDGTGLGLAIVKAIATAHGGSVAIDPEAASGTTVRITIPAPPIRTAVAR